MTLKNMNSIFHSIINFVQNNSKNIESQYNQLSSENLKRLRKDCMHSPILDLNIPYRDKEYKKMKSKKKNVTLQEINEEIDNLLSVNENEIFL
jgi:hypothetical protein